MEINQYIDHTLLAANATSAEIQKICEEAVEHEFYAVCVNSSYVKTAKNYLKSSNVKLAATVGFPLGAASAESKIEEASQAVRDGADEIDMVMNIGFLKDNKAEKVQEEISEIKKAIGDKVLKVILETCYLTEEEIRSGCELSLKAGADFVKTSTGFGSRGASKEDISIMKDVVGDKMKIKASGGIRDAKTAREYIDLGVHRIGTSSGIKIVTEKTEE